MADVSVEEMYEKLRLEYLDEARFLLEQWEEACLSLDQGGDVAAELARLFRAAHTIKGSGAAVGFNDLVSFAHEAEDLLSRLRTEPSRLDGSLISLLLRCKDRLGERIAVLRKPNPGPWSPEDLLVELRQKGQSLSQTAPMALPHRASPEVAPSAEAEVGAAPPGPAEARPKAGEGGRPTSSTIKVEAERLDRVLDVVGELIVMYSQLATRAAPYLQDLALSSVLTQINAKINELQDRSLGIRMTPFKPLFNKARRIVRDLSEKLSKPVHFSLEGEDIEVDRVMIDMLTDPLMHILRNSMDHGLESPQARPQAGKATEGSIALRAYQMGSKVILEIQDDGRGLDRRKIAQKAKEKGLIPKDTPVEELGDQEIHPMIFLPGFSTAEAVTEVSGRGVGLDVVRAQIERLKGTIDIKSSPGKGCTFRIALPLTTSIADGILVMVGGLRYVIRIEPIRELVKTSRRDLVNYSGTQRIFSVRDELLPVVALGELLPRAAGRPAAADDQEHESMMLVVEHRGRRVALAIDAVIGQIQVVLKAIEGHIRSIPGLTGAAVMGDGSVCLVLDAFELLDSLFQVSGGHGEALRDGKVAA